jgi:RNA polymerase sigma factor (sigma-70 family)
MSDPSALRAEFEREAIPHMPALYTFAVRMTRDEDDASDLVQETYLKAYRFFDKFERGTNCKAWLFRILKNSYINRFRKTSKAPDTVEYDVIEEFYETIRDSSVETSVLEEQIFSQVRSRLHRARKILAAQLASYARERGFDVDSDDDSRGNELHVSDGRTPE